MSTDDDDDDEYIIHGKLLDPIHEDEVVKRKDAEQQFVKDENGRRRFHGAFTGGFSAGFYNTVGSLEGWTPSTFKSSRDSKSKLKSQNAYDFMDEEDKKDLGIDASSLKIKAEYSDHSSRKRQLPIVNTGPIPGKPVLGEILKPIKDTWGVELLKSMGWKPGQGVGPQLTQQEKLRAKKELKNVGMKFSIDTKYGDDDDDEVNELLNNIKVSPFEYESVAIKPKFDTFGLGYEGLKTTNVSVKSENKYSKLTVGGKSIHGQAFGVGAYEDDDDDIYAAEDMSNYDFSLEEKSQKLKNKSKINNLNPECIDGFVEDESKHGLFEDLPPPIQIPPEWRPRGMFDRIVGQCPPDFYSQPLNSTNTSYTNVNTRQREMKKPEPPPSVEEFIKKEVPSSLSDIISDRFTRAELPDDSTNALIPVIRTTDPTLERLKNYASKQMYGFWTRKTEPWVPDKLLCKRFNIPVPKQSMINYTEDGKKHGECSLFNSLEFPTYESVSTSESKIPNSLPLAINNVITDNDKPLKLNESIMEATSDEVESQKPSVDFFKDIFLDDSDDETLIVQNSIKSEEVSTNSNEKELRSTNISIKKENTVESNVQSSSTFNLFPPKGIFANLNFGDLFDTPNKNNKNENEHSSKNQTDNINKSYGPILPAQRDLNSSLVNIKVENSFVDDDWVEKSESPTNISNNKNKHSKHKKHKHKHKSKKKSHKHK
ncbi:G patch domain-containing protein 1 [Rhopalosiphum maidis]|uniref:G patch domain-containing protein 1 n=1 Tax=Rhopalosiphum maidis TaxID=43146 RepID=UPI000EFFFDE1|nr:G patch domain-containing protein 1 [Rhopalosiphum maidis]